MIGRYFEPAHVEMAGMKQARVANHAFCYLPMPVDDCQARDIGCPSCVYTGATCFLGPGVQTPPQM